MLTMNRAGRIFGVVLLNIIALFVMWKVLTTYVTPTRAQSGGERSEKVLNRLLIRGTAHIAFPVKSYLIDTTDGTIIKTFDTYTSTWFHISCTRDKLMLTSDQFREDQPYTSTVQIYDLLDGSLIASTTMTFNATGPSGGINFSMWTCPPLISCHTSGPCIKN